MTQKKNPVDIDTDESATAHLHEANRLKAAAIKLRSKADMSKLCIEVAQQTVVSAMDRAAIDEKAALEAESVAKQAGVKAKMCVESELGISPVVQTPSKQPTPPEMPEQSSPPTSPATT